MQVNDLCLPSGAAGCVWRSAVTEVSLLAVALGGELGLVMVKARGFLCWNSLWGCSWAQVSAWGQPCCLCLRHQQLKKAVKNNNGKAFPPASPCLLSFPIHLLWTNVDAHFGNAAKNHLLPLFYLKKQKRVRKLFTDIHCSHIWYSCVFL